MNPGAATVRELSLRTRKVNYMNQPARKKRRRVAYRTKLHDAVFSRPIASGAETLRCHLAVMECRKETAAVLISAGAEIDTQDQDKRTAMHYAAENGLVGVIMDLIASGADLNLKDKAFRTALHLAVMKSRGEIAAVLISAGANINTQDQEERTALHYAAEIGLVQVVKILVASGADLNLRDKALRTALLVALKQGKEEAAMMLIKEDAKYDMRDRDGKTALYYAAEQNYFEIVKKLLASGAMTRYRDGRGMTPLFAALVRCSEDAAEALLEADPGLGAEFGGDLKTALHYAAEGNSVRVMRRLLASGADTRRVDLSGLTPLHVALNKRNNETAEVLLEANAERGVRDLNGWTALHYAANYYYPGMVKRILFRDVDPHVSGIDRKYPLEIALDNKFNNIVKRILSMCVLRDVDIDWKKWNLDDEQTLYCTGLLSEFEAELRRMKQMKLCGTNLSYYDFVKGHIIKVARYLENEKARSVLLADDAAWRFLNYGEYFTFKVRRAEKRRILSNQCFQCFTVLPKSSPKKKQPSLPIICTDLILAHLSEREMQNFVQAFRYKSRRQPSPLWYF